MCACFSRPHVGTELPSVNMTDEVITESQVCHSSRLETSFSPDSLQIDGTVEIDSDGLKWTDKVRMNN